MYLKVTGASICAIMPAIYDYKRVYEKVSSIRRSKNKLDSKLSDCVGASVIPAAWSLRTLLETDDNNKKRMM